MTLPIALFLLFGAGFGLATYTRRHLFSEGPTLNSSASEQDFLSGRLMWMLICTFLWPIMALTGVHSMALMARRRARSAHAREAQQPPRR